MTAVDVEPGGRFTVWSEGHDVIPGGGSTEGNLGKNIKVKSYRVKIKQT